MRLYAGLLELQRCPPSRRCLQTSASYCVAALALLALLEAAISLEVQLSICLVFSSGPFSVKREGSEPKTKQRHKCLRLKDKKK